MMRGIFFFALLLSVPSARVWACASCGCTLSSDWEESSQTGIKLDLRYDYINQNQLRSGTGTISPAAASHLSNNGAPQEVEEYTKNNYVTGSAEYSLNSTWKIAAQIPYILRNHSTLGTASDGQTGGPGGGEYTSNTSSLGDMRLFGRYQGFSEEHNLGVVVGLKLPTGAFNLTGTSTDPTAPGSAPIDRGLQPGSGTVDMILGAYYTRAWNKNFDYFGEALFQHALDDRDGYRPGNGYNLNVGLRYMGVEAVTPQIQINTRYVEHDSGVNSDTISTGGTLIYISPGLTVPLPKGFEVYGFVQVPLYQNLLGVQLAPTYTASLGGRYYF